MMSIVSFISEGILIYSFAFLTLMPDYVCYEGDNHYQCTRQETCEIDKLNQSGLSIVKTGYDINWDTTTSLNNLVQVLDLRCAENWKIGFMGSCYFIGAVFGNLFLSKYGDTIGRIPMVRIGISLSLTVYTIVLFISTSLYLNYCLIFVFGALTCFRVSTAYLYG
jgi:MFS family permease